MNLESSFILTLLDKRFNYSQYICSILEKFGSFPKDNPNAVFLASEIEYYKVLIKSIDDKISSLSIQKSV
jgi:hypothetical protein